jgi:microcystin-dependent protein
VPQIFGLIQNNSLVCFPGIIQPFGGTVAPAGWLICDGSAINRAIYSNLFAALGTVWGVGDGATTFNIPDLRGVVLRGADSNKGNDPDRASRTAIQSGTFTITSSVTTSGSPNVTVSSTSNLAPGMSVTGTGIPANTVVLSITSSTVFVLGAQTGGTSVNATASGTVTLTFSNSATADFVGSYQADGFASHNHPIWTQGGAASGTGAGCGVQQNIYGAEFTTPIVNSGGNETRPKNVNVNYIIKY